MIPQRITDYLRERRIRALCERIKAAQRAGRRDDARALYTLWAAELACRSAEQIARMERAQLKRMSPQNRALFERYRDADQ